MSASSLIFPEHVKFARETAEVTPQEAEQCGCRFILEVQARRLFASKDDRVPSETPDCHSRIPRAEPLVPPQTEGKWKRCPNLASERSQPWIAVAVRDSSFRTGPNPHRG